MTYIAFSGGKHCTADPHKCWTLLAETAGKTLVKTWRRVERALFTMANFPSKKGRSFAKEKCTVGI